MTVEKDSIQTVVKSLISFLIIYGISHALFTYKLNEKSSIQDRQSSYMLSLTSNFDGPNADTPKFKDESVWIEVAPPKYKSKFETAMNKKWRNSQGGYLFDFEVEKLAKSMKSTYRSPVVADDIVFLMLASKKLQYRSLSQLRTWLIWAKHFYIVSDEHMNLPNEIVINKTGSSYESAGERHWRSVIWLNETKPELMSKKWFVLVDDDTWINIPALCRYLRDFDPNWNVAIGQVDYNYFVANRTFLQGGSGEVFSRTAFKKLAKNLFSRGCRYNRHGDVSLWGCYRVGQTVLIHSDKFSHYSVPVEKILHYYALYPPNYVTQISFHHINNFYVKMTMTCDVAEEWKVAEPPECEQMRNDPKKTYITKLPTLNNLVYPHFGYGFIM